MYGDNQDIGSTFWPLWQQHQDYLYHCCVKWTDNVVDAEDALSWAMLKAWYKICNSPVEIKNFKAWVSQLTYNLCVDIHREHHRGGRQVESLDTIGFEEQEIASQEAIPVLVATQQELENFFCVAINELPIRMQETFILHFKEELSYTEIAEKLNISYDNVRKRISQARAILKQRYDQDFIGEKDRYSSDLDECKSQAIPQPPKRKKSENNHQSEAFTGETLVLFDELEIGEVVVEDEQEEEVVVLQLVVVDSQSDGEVEEVIKESDVNDDCLPMLDVLEFWRIGKNRLSKTLKWCNFQSRQDIYPTIINAIFFYLFYYQVFWQKWGDSGGIRSPTSFFIISINDHKCSEVGDLTE